MRLYISNFKKILYAFASLLLIAALCVPLLLKCFKITWRPRENLFYFYQLEKNSLDVINIGSSHVYCSINTIDMYRKSGITAYNLAAGAQPVWFSYYYLKEALKTQNPKLVILDVYTVRETEDEAFADKVQMNILTLKPSLDKLEAVRISETNDKWNVFWGFPKIHARYREVTAEEYSEDVCRNMMGYAYMPSAEAKDNAEVLDAENVSTILPISEKAEKYLRKCIELCQEKNIAIVLVNSPFADVKREDEERYNYVAEIASEYGIDFIDGCRLYKQLGIDYRSDNAEDSHLSYSGSLKWTEYLRQYLTERYQLPDHRGERKIWEDASAALDQLLISEHLKELDSAEAYIKYLQDNSDAVSYIIAAHTGKNVDEEIQRLLLEMGLDMTEEKCGYVLSLKEGYTSTQGGMDSDKQLYAAIYDSLQSKKEQIDDSHLKNLLLQYTQKIADSRTTEGVLCVVLDPYSYLPLDIVEFKEAEAYMRSESSN